MKRIFIGLVLFLVFFSSTSIQAQQIKHINSPSNGSPYLIFIAEQGLIPALELKISKYKNEQDCAFVIINADQTDAINVKDSINNILNSSLGISKQYVHLIFAGDNHLLGKFNRYEDDFFANLYFLREDEEILDYGAVLSSEFGALDFENLLEILNKTYRWPVFLEEIKEKHAVYSYKNKKKFNMGFGTGPVFPIVKNTDAYVPAAFNQFSFQFDKGLNKRNYLNGSINFSFKIPKPQEIIQDQLFGQIDIFELVFGGGDLQEVELDVKIKGHGYLNLNLENRFILSAKSDFQPYAGAGLAFTRLIAFETALDTTIIIDPDSIDFGGGFDRDSLSTEFDPTVLTRFSVPLSLGFQKSLGKRWTFDMNVRYTFDFQNLSNNQVVLNTLSVNMSLVYKFLGRRNVYYKYVRLRDKA